MTERIAGTATERLIPHLLPRRVWIVIAAVALVVATAGAVIIQGTATQPSPAGAASVDDLTSKAFATEAARLTALARYHEGSLNKVQAAEAARYQGLADAVGLSRVQAAEAARYQGMADAMGDDGG